MRSGCITSFLDKLRLTGTCFTMGLPCFLAVLYVILMYSWHLVACGLPSNQSFLWRRKRTNICNFCTNPVLEGLLAFKALQPHPNLSIVACSVHKHCLNLSHDDILLGKQKSQEAGDDEAVANSGGPADPIHLRLSMRAHGVSDFGGPTGASMISFARIALFVWMIGSKSWAPNPQSFVAPFVWKKWAEGKLLQCCA